MNTFLAVVSGEQLVNTLVWVILAGLVFWLAVWLVDYCKTPEPFNRVLKVIIAVIAFLFLVNVLLGLVGKQIIKW